MRDPMAHRTRSAQTRLLVLALSASLAQLACQVDAFEGADEEDPEVSDALARSRMCTVSPTMVETGAAYTITATGLRIGAAVRVFWNGKQQLQEVSGGSGFCAQNDRRLHFGLGPRARIERVEIRWPSGKVQTLENVSANQLHRIQEPS